MPGAKERKRRNMIEPFNQSRRREDLATIKRKSTKNVYFFKKKFLEISHGQITEALSFLHYSGHVIHRNVCPSSILVTKKGTWKLAGLEFIGKLHWMCLVLSWHTYAAYTFSVSNIVGLEKGLLFFPRLRSLSLYLNTVHAYFCLCSYWIL